MLISFLLTIPVGPIISKSTRPTFANFHVGRTVAVDDQSEVSFSIPQGTLPRQPNFVGFIHTTEFWPHSADGVGVW